MLIDNLKVGQRVKNYKELCSILNVPVLKANSKKAQLKEFARHVRYDNVGQAFYIREIYSEVLEKIDRRGIGNSKYKHHMENLILCSLHQCKGSVGYISKSSLMSKTGLVSTKFFSYKDDKIELADFLGIQYEQVGYFYDDYTNFFIGILDSALESLENKSIIKKEDKIMIFKDGLNRFATDTEISLILDFENKILQELGCLNKSEVAAKKLNFKFNNIIKSKCREHLGFDGYYTVYKIFYGKKAVESAISKLDAIDIDKALKVSMRTHIISTLDKKWQQKQPTGFGYNHAIPPKEVYRDNMLEIFDFIVPNRTNAQYALN